jgi:hypothetical protein
MGTTSVFGDAGLQPCAGDQRCQIQERKDDGLLEVPNETSERVGAMNYHLRYWLARLRNEFRQLTLQPPSEKDVVGEVMGKLKLNPELRKLLDEAEAKIEAEDKSAEGKTRE